MSSSLLIICTFSCPFEECWKSHLSCLSISKNIIDPLSVYPACFPLSSDLFPHTVPPVCVCVCVRAHARVSLSLSLSGWKSQIWAVVVSCLHMLYSLCKKISSLCDRMTLLTCPKFTLLTLLPWYSVQWNLCSLFFHRPWKENNKCGKMTFLGKY